MALFTTLVIVLTIDEIEFNITASNLKKEQQNTLKEKYGSFDAEFNERNENEVKLSRMIERYQLLKSDGQTKKALELLDQIENLESDMSHKNIEETEKMLNDLYQSRFLMTISGDDKKRLQNYIEEHNIGYMTVMKEIESLAVKAREGKLKD